LPSQTCDVAAIGQNAVDTLILARKYPTFAGKERFDSEIVAPGGQVATAAVTCASLGLRTRYVGSVGDDAAAGVQRASLVAAGIDLAHIVERTGCATQSAYIVVDAEAGERTVLWRRDPGLALQPREVRPEWIAGARLVHLDAGDLPAIIRVAEMARAAGIPVSLDADTLYPELGRLFASVDYLVAASGLLEKWTNEGNPVRALERAQHEYGCRAVGVALGAGGCLLFTDGRMHYSPGFSVDCIDTTGAGDVFHGAFCYSVLEKMAWPDALDFSNAMAALNCRALGARGAIASREEAAGLMRTGERRRRAGF
jgi:sulfofructose kinase